MTIKTYVQANAYLGDKQSRKLPSIRATELRRKWNGEIALSYQGTDVVTYFADDTAMLDTGGWQTSTTKSRINEFSHARVYQRKHRWYLSENQPFYDGAVVDSEGWVVDGNNN